MGVGAGGGRSCHIERQLVSLPPPTSLAGGSKVNQWRQKTGGSPCLPWHWIYLGSKAGLRQLHPLQLPGQPGRMKSGQEGGGSLVKWNQSQRPPKSSPRTSMEPTDEVREGHKPPGTLGNVGRGRCPKRTVWKLPFRATPSSFLLAALQVSARRISPPFTSLSSFLRLKPRHLRKRESAYLGGRRVFYSSATAGR